MRRRDFLGVGAALATTAISGPAVLLSKSLGAESGGGLGTPPQRADRIAGMTLAQLRDDYRDRLFNQYLPFWEKGGVDRQYGGFICELNDDGSVADSEKFSWYQGRGLWVYSFLYNKFGKDRRWLETARQARDFMVRHVHADGGRWYEKVARDGKLVEGIGENVYGWIFCSMGLAEYYLASGQKEDLDLARQSLLAAMKAYDDPSYCDTFTPKYTGLDLEPRGLRSQGHSMTTIALLTGLLAHHADPQLEELQRQHVDRVMNKFWNPQYRIVNEYLQHDYSREPNAAQHMYAGHSVETLRIVMDEAVRRKDKEVFEAAANRVRHLLTMCWDYNFDGFGDSNFYIFGTKTNPRGPGYDVKTMWAQCEAMSACLMVMDRLGADWGRQWYERLRAFALKTMPVAGHGVWRQAVDRMGQDLKRVGYSVKRKDNFHQARCMMLDLLTLDRMIAKEGAGWGTVSSGSLPN